MPFELQHAGVGEKDDLHRAHGFGDLQRDGVGIDPEGAALAIEAERRDHRRDAFVQKEVQRFGIDALHLAGVLEIDAAEDAGGMRDDHIGEGSAQIDRGEALHDLVHHVGRRLDAELQRGLVGDAGAVRIRNGDAARFGELRDLPAGAVHEDHFDAERPQHGDIQQDIREIGRGDDVAIQRDHEDFFAEARDVLEDAAQIGNFHGTADAGVERMRGARKGNLRLFAPAGCGFTRGNGDCWFACTRPLGKLR